MVVLLASDTSPPWQETTHCTPGNAATYLRMELKCLQDRELGGGLILDNMMRVAMAAPPVMTMGAISEWSIGLLSTGTRGFPVPVRFCNDR
jgi:hypothetical protein